MNRRRGFTIPATIVFPFWAAMAHLEGYNLIAVACLVVGILCLDSLLKEAQ